MNKKKNSKIVKIHMDSCDFRVKMCEALSQSGYPCWTETVKARRFYEGDKYYVCFINESKQKDDS